MFFSVVLTGNHFIVDAVAGGIVSFAGFGIALAYERLQPFRRLPFNRRAKPEPAPLIF